MDEFRTGQVWAHKKNGRHVVIDYAGVSGSDVHDTTTGRTSTISRKTLLSDWVLYTEVD